MDDETGIIVTPTTKVAKEATLQRFAYLARSFLLNVASVKPVVLWVDDWQWADETSRRFFQSLAQFHGDENAPLSTQLVAFGTIQDDDEAEFQDIQELLGSGSSHQQNATTTTTRTSSVTWVALPPLTENVLNEFVAKVTNNARQAHVTQAFTNLIQTKTLGNIYFFRRYLEMLNREDLLSFNFMTAVGEWDIAEIQTRTDVSDDVVQLLTKKSASLVD